MTLFKLIHAFERHYGVRRVAFDFEATRRGSVLIAALQPFKRPDALISKSLRSHATEAIDAFTAEMAR